MAGILREIIGAYTYGMNSVPNETQLEKNSSTYKKGAVLIQNAGVLDEGVANPVGIVGIAEQAGQNGTSKTVRYVPAADQMVFEGQLDDNTLTNTYVSVAADLGASYGLTKEAASGFWWVDKSKTGANARAYIVGFKSPVGSTNPRVYFVIKQSLTAPN